MIQTKNLTMKMKTVVLPQLWQAIRTLLQVLRSRKIWRNFAKEKTCYTNNTGPAFFSQKCKETNGRCFYLNNLMEYVNKESNQTNLYTVQTCILQLICTGISNSNKTSND